MSKNSNNILFATTIEEQAKKVNFLATHLQLPNKLSRSQANLSTLIESKQ